MTLCLRQTRPGRRKTLVSRLTVLLAPAHLLFCSIAIIPISAHAQIAGNAAAPSQRQFQINLPSLPLAEALKEIARQTDEDILFASQEVSGIRAPPLQGKMSALSAVRHLTADTKLEAFSTGARSLIVRRRPTRSSLPPEPKANPTPVPAALFLPDQTEQAVVTGTNIRGSQLIGSRLKIIDRGMIENTASVDTLQMLKLMPSITAFGGSGIGQLPGVSYYAPTIHSLGASGSNSTLVLVDGHRLPEGGNQHVLPDPNIIPAIAIDRIEILADGSSSTYGSDAVAGVINFITRRNFNGAEVDFQSGFGANYGTMSGGLLLGRNWDTGWSLFAYGYSRTANPSVDYHSRPYTVPDRTALAIRHGLLPPDTPPSRKTSSATFSCDPATIQMYGDNAIFSTVTANATVANLPQNSPCPYGPNTPGSYNGTGAETRHAILVKFSQDISNRLAVSGSFDYATRDTYSHVAAPTLIAKAFQTGAQANPFYQVPAGYSGSAAAQIIRWDATKLLGYGLNDNRSTDWFLLLREKYQLSERILLTASQMVASDESFVITNAGTLNINAATLALNGTTNAIGDTTMPMLSGFSHIPLNIPLTTANALDVWNPAATNQTSPAVRAALTDNQRLYRGAYHLQDFHLGIQGEMISLPGGQLHFAAGLEHIIVHQNAWNNSPGDGEFEGRAAAMAYYPLKHNVISVYGELEAPLVGPMMDIPFIRRLHADISARFDDYSDVGTTTNPKIGAEWQVNTSVQLRANWSTSFVAPSQRSVGSPKLDGLNVLSRVLPSTASASVPTASFPNIIGVPGCLTGSVTCQINADIPGVYRYTGNPNTKPEKGRSWNIGIDLTPDLVPNLSLSITMFDTRFYGGVTSPPLSAVINNTSLNKRLYFCNPGAPCTQAQVQDFIGNVPIRKPLPTPVYYLFDQRQTNVLNLAVRGLDISANYAYRTDTAGSFTVAVMATDFLRFNENYSGSPKFSVLNTSGYNTTFPSIALQAGMMVEWDFNTFSTTLFVRHIGGYRNWSGTTITPIRTARKDGQSIPVGGGDPVEANTTLDAHLSYSLAGLKPDFADSRIYLDISNLLGTDPPFYNTGTVSNTVNSTQSGFDPYGASNLGRVISIGLHLRF